MRCKALIAYAGLVALVYGCKEVTCADALDCESVRRDAAPEGATDAANADDSSTPSGDAGTGESNPSESSAGDGSTDDGGVDASADHTPDAVVTADAEAEAGEDSPVDGHSSGCTSAENACADANTLRTCNATGTGFDSTSCIAGCSASGTPHCQQLYPAAPVQATDLVTPNIQTVTFTPGDTVINTDTGQSPVASRARRTWCQRTPR